MNIEKITAYGNRNPKELKEKGVENPIAVGPKNRVCFTDVASAIIFDSSEVETKTQVNNNILIENLTRDFKAKGADVASFMTTIGDLTAWLRKDTDPCSFCNGAGPCPSIEVEKTDDTSSELEDAQALHYGWIGPAPVNRARLDELLGFTEMPPETPIMLQAVMHERDHQNAPEVIFSYFSAVWVTGPDNSFELFLGGLNEKTEAAPKFHLEGVFTTPEMKKAGKTKKAQGTKIIHPAPTPTKKAATPVQTKKKAAATPTKQPTPKKAEAKKPVTKTKVVTKKAPPPDTKGMSALDRAMAKKAAGRKKK